MKLCSVCKESKPLDEFHRDSRAKDGRGTRCKSCSCARSRQWRQENPERVKANSRAAYERNPDAYKARARAAYASDPKRIRERIAAWQAENRERCLEYSRRTYAKTPEVQKARRRRYYEANRHRWIGYNHARRALEGKTTPEVQALIGELRARACVYCGSTEKIEIDHVVPLARGGKHEPENLAPACRSCNRSKGASLLSEWLERTAS